MVEGNFYHFFNFWRPAVVCVAPATGEKSIIPCASTFVNIKFAQKINQMPPEILSFAQTKKILKKNKKTLAFFKPIAYNNTCKEQTTTIEKEIGWGMDKRINYLMGLDTETCNGIVTDDKLAPTCNVIQRSDCITKTIIVAFILCLIGASAFAAIKVNEFNNRPTFDALAAVSIDGCVEGYDGLGYVVDNNIVYSIPDDITEIYKDSKNYKKIRS